MKLTLANIRDLKKQSSSPLYKRVCNYVISEWGSYSDKTNIFKDVLYHGCQSGMVGFLIYYSDMDYEGGKIAFAYVWNKDAADCSEFGDICVKSFGGGIKRVG